MKQRKINVKSMIVLKPTISEHNTVYDFVEDVVNFVREHHFDFPVLFSYNGIYISVDKNSNEQDILEKYFNRR